MHVHYTVMEDDASDNIIIKSSDAKNSDNSRGDSLEALERTVSFNSIYETPLHTDKKYETKQTLLLAYQSLGVVYGDLATSPVNVFSSTRLTNLTEEDLLGALSLIIWALTFLVLIKYVFIVLHANDHGEGGTFALYSYLCRHINIRSKFTFQNIGLETNSYIDYYSSRSHLGNKTKKFLERSTTAQNFLTTTVLLGTCMVIGDGALTPATCVLSALQGIQSRSSKITQEHVVWMSVALLVALFAFQRCGTSKVSSCFSPIMVLWFATNVSVSVYNIIKYHPSVLKAVSPHYIVKFFMRNGNTAWDLLGAVFLGITGAEAMYADLGHFNKRAIQLGFSFVVYPALVLTYAGETAYLIKNPQNISDAYYSSLPDVVYWPMFVISTLAAIVASQSMITASFSIVKQSISLGCFPHVSIVHTSSNHKGQVYSPEINYVLMILTVGLVVGFKGGIELANAYGVVVIWVMIITTFLTAIVMLVIWETNLLLVLGFFLPYTLVEGIFMASSLQKIPQGGWVPLAISAIFLTIMLSWTYGRYKKTEYEAGRNMTIPELDQLLSNNVYRTPGICFFFTDLVNEIPPIVRHYIQHTVLVREILLIVTTRTLPTKTVLPDERFNVEKLGNEWVYRCLVEFGCRDSQDMKEDEYIACMVAQLQQVTDREDEKLKIQQAAHKGCVFVIGSTILKANKENGGLARFTIDYLYKFLQNNTRSAVSTLQIPSERTLQVGMIYEI